MEGHPEWLYKQAQMMKTEYMYISDNTDTWCAYTSCMHTSRTHTSAHKGLKENMCALNE